MEIDLSKLEKYLETVPRRGRKHNWAAVDKFLREHQLVTLKQIQQVAGCKYRQQAQQWVARRVCLVVDMDVRKTFKTDNKDGYIVKVITGNNVFFTHIDNIK